MAGAELDGAWPGNARRGPGGDHQDRVGDPVEWKLADVIDGPDGVDGRCLEKAEAGVFGRQVHRLEIADRAHASAWRGAEARDAGDRGHELTCGAGREVTLDEKGRC